MSIFEEIVGKSIETFGFEDGVIYLMLDDGKTFMLTMSEDSLYVEVYDKELQ